MENDLVIYSISDLLDKKFIVPSYQRGYRWKEDQVEMLMNDLYIFTQKTPKTPNEFYCLQPVVVKANNKGAYVLIDGQQRLTTIYILLHYLKELRAIIDKGTFSIEYETRVKSSEFLSKIDPELVKDNIDFFHMNKAYETIDRFFKRKDGAFKLKLLSPLINWNDFLNRGGMIRFVLLWENEKTGRRLRSCRS